MLMDNYCSMTVLSRRESRIWKSVVSLVLIGVGLHIPPPKRLACALTAEELLVFLLCLVHLQQVVLGQVLCLYQLVHMMMSNSGIVGSVLGRLTEQVTVWYTCVVYWLEHSPDYASKFLVREMIFLSQLSDFVFIQHWPETLSRRKISHDISVSHHEKSITTFEQFGKKIL